LVKGAKKINKLQVIYINLLLSENTTSWYHCWSKIKTNYSIQELKKRSLYPIKPDSNLCSWLCFILYKLDCL